ncbi:hypothetical protein K1719_004631 [Acacia pycnantha]|nr:hypothetical protein K1719_004631 [Acacia pycnantha]
MLLSSVVPWFYFNLICKGDFYMFYEVLIESQILELMRSFESPLFIPTLEPPRKLNYAGNPSPGQISKLINDSNGFNETSNSSPGQIVGNLDVTSSQSMDDKITVDKETF